LDADGINVLAGQKEIIKKIKNEIVLTPHPKEFSRFLGISIDEVLNNKIELVKANAKELNCTIVLKGPATIIGTKEGNIYVSPFSNSALAKGGTGDVLAGFIGGLIAQGLKPDLAACVGVYIHGKTAEMVAKDKTVFSLLPQDLISYLPQAIKMYI
jgi:NAD(P)H-hydrate epimerase